MNSGRAALLISAVSFALLFLSFLMNYEEWIERHKARKRAAERKKLYVGDEECDCDCNKKKVALELKS